ncbi:type VII secretion-associated serine protease mycosin [Catenulispora subtropica]|uniref:Type VII secretion-associated serine protease mycosin n=1 Tax=Catenulispora subtropica TaxID=450798 RepID=A0ABN2SUL3_9ACTN
MRNAAVMTLAAGCLLSSAGMSRASQSTGAGAAQVGANRCRNPLPAPNLPSGAQATDLLWPQSKMGLGAAGVWYLSRGKGVTVAVIDTGVDKANPVFGPDTVLSGPSVVDLGDSANYDCDGHGTAVAAIIAGRENGVDGFSGVAPDATVLPIRQTDTVAKPGSAVRLADAIRTATAAGARVITISIGTTEDSPDLRSAVQDALAHDVVVVAAAGTGGPASATTRPNAKFFPAAIPGVLAVGSVDRDGNASSFAQKGVGAVIAAPGGRMAVPAAGYPGALTAEQGTGFAAAFAAGTAALVLSYRPTLHNWQVVQRLEVTADRPASGALDASVGWGVVNPYRAVSTVLPDEGRPDPSLGPDYRVEPASAAVPGNQRTMQQVVLGVAGGGVLMLAVPVITAAVRRGRIRGTRAGV